MAPKKKKAGEKVGWERVGGWVKSELFRRLRNLKPPVENQVEKDLAARAYEHDAMIRGRLKKAMRGTKSAARVLARRR